MERWLVRFHKIKTYFNKIKTYFNKIRTYFYQFRILSAIRFSCAELSRKLLDSCNIPSYSQTGEDRILANILGNTGFYVDGNTGFYVDVGCNHPQAFSNTFELYKRGWMGVNIDANQHLIKKHQRLRKRDLSICAAVSDQEQEVVFTDFEDSLVSSLSAEHISEWGKVRKIKEKRIVNTVSLSRILDGCNAPKDFDLLCIDVEGHDFEVLSSLNLSIYRPKLIVIEMHSFDLLDPSSSKIYEYLRVNDYKMMGYVVMNGYFSDVSTKKYSSTQSPP
jgi:FkbM family methyltransferase